MEKNSVSNKTLAKLKYDLVRDQLITYEDLEKSEEIAAAQKQNIGQVLINKGLITEEVLLDFHLFVWDVPFFVICSVE